MSNQPEQRDYSLFDADLSGAVLNMHLLGRLPEFFRALEGLPRWASFSFQERISGKSRSFEDTLNLKLG